MIPRDTEAEILRLFRAEKWPAGTIAKELRVHHSVVERVLDQQGFVRSSRHRPSIVEPYLPFIVEQLQKYPRLHASRLFQMVKERGYPGGADHFRTLVARHRPRPPAEAYLRIRTLPGEEGQVDWAHFGTLEVDGGVRKLFLFLMVLAYSRRLFARFYLSCAMAAFLRGHVAAFQYFGGVARTNRYDNLKSVVTERVGQAIRFHPTHLQLAGHYQFEPKPCNPARGNEKGRVEKAVSHVRTSFFAARIFRHLEDLNEQLARWLVEVSDQRKCPEDKHRTVAEVFADEQPRLLALPDNPFPCDERLDVHVGKTPYVRFDRNDYSVPHTHVRKTLVVSATLDTVRVLDGTACVATHARSWGVGKQIEEPAHVQALLDHKQQARQHRGTDQLHHVSPFSQLFLCKVAERGGNLGFTVAKLLRHLDAYGPEALDAALREAVERDTPHLGAIRYLLDRRRHELSQPPPIGVPVSDDPRVQRQRVHLRDLSAYDRIARTTDDESPTP